MTDNAPDPTTGWRQAARVFDERAGEYDRWFEGGRLLFEIELAALRKIRTPLPEPRLEVGVGPGRFAEALGLSLGLDPAGAALKLAGNRGVQVCQGVAEALPVKDHILGTVFMLFTLCFLAEPRQALVEAHRVLQDKGCLVLGMVPAAGAWGLALAAKKARKHPFYEHARFYEVALVTEWLTAAGFEIREVICSLFQPPSGLIEMEQPRPGFDGRAGFAVLVARRRGPRSTVQETNK